MVMQLLACFWIALCLVVDTSTKSVTSTEDETGIGDLRDSLYRNADGNLRKDAVCKEDDKGKIVCTCPPEWGVINSKACKKCDCGKDVNCTFSYFWMYKTCFCKDGYEDKLGFCRPTCKTNPCLNGGQCTVKGRDIECKCKNSFAGERCEEKVACNEREDCRNGGKCSKIGKDGFCRCRTGTEGPFCEIVSECANMNCGKDAVCLYDLQTEKAVCQCRNDTLLFDPDTKRCKNDCLPNPCRNGGSCTATIEKATCHCKDGFRGADCSIDICLPNPCRNGGVCDGTSGEVTCQCKDRFRGADCSIDVCSPNPCQNGGICSTTRGEAMCQCKDRFRGADCSIDVCLPNPCQNGGICNVANGKVTCQCKDRFRGADCSIEWKNL